MYSHNQPATHNIGPRSVNGKTVKFVGSLLAPAIAISGCSMSTEKPEISVKTVYGQADHKNEFTSVVTVPADYNNCIGAEKRSTKITLKDKSGLEVREVHVTNKDPEAYVMGPGGVPGGRIALGVDYQDSTTDYVIEGTSHNGVKITAEVGCYEQNSEE